MPRATVWIRTEDWETWQAIDKKAEWLHEHLNSKPVTMTIETHNEESDYTLKFKPTENTEPRYDDIIDGQKLPIREPKYEPMDD